MLVKMAGVQRNASSPHAAAPGGGAGGAPDDGVDGVVPRVTEHLTYSATTTEDPADSMDDDVVSSGRWMDTEIAVGSFVAILVVAALVAVWISCRRRRRRDSPALGATTADRMRSTLHEVTEIQRKISSMKPLSLQLGNGKDASNGSSNGSSNGGGVPPVATIVLPPSTPSPVPDPTALVTPSPWEPYLLGAPGKKGKPLRARRRSVSLRSADDDAVSDDASVVSGTPSRGPSPSPSLRPEDGGAELTRKRSVTFNAMVEEVQILVR